MGEHFGFTFYSEFFNSWCVVVKYKNDKNWWFVAENRPQVLKAQTDFKNVLIEKGK